MELFYLVSKGEQITSNTTILAKENLKEDLLCTQLQHYVSKCT